MTDVVTYKSQRQKEREQVEDNMIADLERLITRIRKGEVIGLAIAHVDAASRAHTDWKGNCSAPALGHAIGCLSHRFFQQNAK